MIKLNAAILEKLDEEIETSDIQKAVKSLDQIRYILADDEDNRPPSVRDDLRNLHQLLFKIIRERYAPAEDDGEKIIDLVDTIETTMTTIVEHAERILEIIAPIERILLETSEEDDDVEDDEDSYM